MAARDGLIEGILNRLAAAEDFNDISWILGETVVTATQKKADAIVKSNVSFQAESGLNPVLKRIPLGTCCNWCRQLAGVYYNYPFPDEYYQRHTNCKCTILFDIRTGKSGSVTNTYTKEKFDDEVAALKKSLKDYNLTESDTWDYYKFKQTLDNDKYVIAEDKITEFLLKPGTKHSEEFFAVGYTQKDYLSLSNDIYKQFDIGKAVESTTSYNGEKRFTIYMELGTSAKRTFKTVWQVKEENGKPRLITAYREDRA